MQTIAYSISPFRPGAHQFRVTCTLEQPDPDGQRFALPAWIPGSYLIRDFARHVLTVRAQCNGQSVAVEKCDKQTWRCAPCAGALTVWCEIYARDESVRAAYLDHRRGFFNGTSVFLQPAGLTENPCTLTIEAPGESVEGDWTVVTTLPASAVDEAGFGDYHADNYLQLIDHPVAMGVVDWVEFAVAGKPHAMVLLGRHDADRGRLAADLAQVCSEHARLFGELPVTRYVFLAQIVGEGYGGLEHRECSMLQVARDSLPAPGTQDTGRPDSYVDMLGLCSHEYFHLWNVKRIRPQAVAQSDLLHEAYFRDLWAYEGVTSYYDDLALLRAKLISSQTYLQKLARAATRLAHNPGQYRQTLAESSFDAWTKFYRPDENTPNAVVSYYGKGGLLALCLDLTLRLQSDGAASLDSVMQQMWQRFGRSETPVPDGGLEALCVEIGGARVQDFFDRYLHATGDLPWVELLGEFGVECKQVMVADGAPGPAPEIAALGVRLNTKSPDLRLQHVLDDSPAQRAGLSPDDVLVAVNGLRVTGANLAARLKRHGLGDKVTVQFFRGDELLAVELQIAAPSADAWRFSLNPDASAAAVARRQSWLGSTA